MSTILKETTTRRRDYFPFVSGLRFGHSGNADCSGVRVSSGNNVCNLFREEMDGLYLLAFLLTANPETTGQCFISGFEDCLEGIAVNDDWAHSWAKRVVIQNAIRLVDPRIHHSESKVLPRFRQEEHEPSERSPDNRTLIGVLALVDFERFAFAMTVLEQLSDRDSALLLGCLLDELRAARVRALEEVAAW